MTIRKYSSRSQQTTLSGSITDVATTISVVSATSLLGGSSVTSPETFTIVIDPDTALEEIVDVTGVAGATLTITRGVDGPTPGTGQAHSAGAVIRHMAIGRDFREANRHIEAVTAYNDGISTHAVHGIASGEGDVVGTTKTQTLTNKTLTSPTITGTGAIAGTFTGNLTGNVTGTVSGNAGTVTNGIYTTDTGTVTSTMIANGTIVDVDVNVSAAIAKTKIAGTAITAADTGTVTSAMILDGTILNADVNAAAAIAATKIAGTAVTQADSGTVTSAMIADGAIVNADINASAAIAKTKLDLSGTITSADIVDGTIVNSDINASAGIALSKLAVDPVARANHTGTQTSSTISNFDTQVRTSKVTDLAAPTGSFSMNSQKITGLADPTLAQDSATKAYTDLHILTSAKGVAGGVASLDGSGLIPQAQLPLTAVTSVQVVASQVAMLALTAEVGDIAVRTDVNKTFILKTAGATVLANWQEMLTPTDSVLSVDGNTGAVDLTSYYLAKAGGTLTGALTLSGAPTVDLHAATKLYVDAVAGSATAAAASASAAASSATDAATTYDDFDDRYLGAKATPPTLDNDGNALLTGAIYWNTATNAMYAWTGSEWGSISSTAAIYRYRFTAAGGETTLSGLDDNGLTLAYMPGKEQVYLNGVLLARTSDYNATDGTSITSLAALVLDDIVEIITFTSFELADAIVTTDFNAKGDLLAATAADTLGVLAVGSNGTVLVADSAEATGLKWSAYDPLPSQGGNTGKYLTTDGSSASWGAITTDPTPTVFLLMGA